MDNDKTNDSQAPLTLTTFCPECNAMQQVGVMGRDAERAVMCDKCGKEYEEGADSSRTYTPPPVTF